MIMKLWFWVFLLNRSFNLVFNLDESHGSVSDRECQRNVAWLEKTDKIKVVPWKGERKPWHCSKPRIVGGTIALSKEFPHMASIAFDRRATKFLCGGSIISEFFILSAAHCQSSPRWGAAKWVLIGDTDLASDMDDAMPTLIPIGRIIPHPDYKEPSYYNDILLFKLKRKIFFSSFIRPVCLHSETSVGFKYAVATGWGRTNEGSKASKELMKVALALVNDTVCQDAYNPLKFKTLLDSGLNNDTMICAGNLNGGYDTCEGDSGGPLLVPSKYHPCIFSQIGITSFGKSCGAPNSPAVYTRVSYFSPWIEKIVWS